MALRELAVLLEPARKACSAAGLEELQRLERDVIDAYNLRFARNIALGILPFSEYPEDRAKKTTSDERNED